MVQSQCSGVPLRTQIPGWVWNSKACMARVRISRGSSLSLLSVWFEDRGCAHSCTHLQGVQNQTPKSCCPGDNFKPRSELDVLAPQFTCSLLNSSAVTALAKLQVEVVSVFLVWAQWCGVYNCPGHPEQEPRAAEESSKGAWCRKESPAMYLCGTQVYSFSSDTNQLQGTLTHPSLSECIFWAQLIIWASIQMLSAQMPSSSALH